jgi:hypothetical protein
MPRHQIIAAHVVTATIKFTGILLVMMRPGPLQWTRTQSPFLLSPTAAGLSSKPGTWAPQGAPFYLWLSINCGMELMTLFAGPIALYPPPWSRTVGEPRGLRGFFHFSEWGLHQKKGPGDGDQPGPNDRAS